MSVKNSYPKAEKLKSRNDITALFTDGKSVSKYPLRLVYKEQSLPNTLKIGVSVSKRQFKKAVDRNYIKRLLRESYRTHKHLINNKIDKPFIGMFIYQGKEVLTFEELNTKMIALLEKFNARNDEVIHS